jgi:hypothetical protein
LANLSTTKKMRYQWSYYVLEAWKPLSPSRNPLAQRREVSILRCHHEGTVVHVEHYDRCLNGNHTQHPVHKFKKKIPHIYWEIQNGAVAKSYINNGHPIYKGNICVYISGFPSEASNSHKFVYYSHPADSPPSRIIPRWRVLYWITRQLLHRVRCGSFSHKMRQLTLLSLADQANPRCFILLCGISCVHQPIVSSESTIVG